jgi:alanine-synthesizing transaminase
VIAGADIRSVPLTPGIDFFAELERAIRGSYPKPKMIVLGFRRTRRRSAWSWISSNA